MEERAVYMEVYDEVQTPTLCNRASETNLDMVDEEGCVMMEMPQSKHFLFPHTFQEEENTTIPASFSLNEENFFYQIPGVPQGHVLGMMMDSNEECYTPKTPAF